ncbi:MAG: TetR/AcrR family transcriptional regulator [Methylococcales bacterium]|nr:TetR/AcrR family transcriptional regulator [Methylococcales bacterium]MBT7409044.1 TetR/AcrR family transcriptional regulator [Methylococcales bacterium]
MLKNKIMGRTSNAKERILDSAQQLIHARSYSDVGVQEICDYANVKKGSFYYYFPSKQELTLAVIDHIWDQFQVTLQQTLNSHLSPLERIRHLPLMAYQINSLNINEEGKITGCPFGNLATEMSTQDEKIRLHLDNIFTKIVSQIEQTLKEGVQCEEIHPIDTHSTAQAIFAYLEGIILLAKTHNQPEMIKALGGHITQLISPIH